MGRSREAKKEIMVTVAIPHCGGRTKEESERGIMIAMERNKNLQETNKIMNKNYAGTLKDHDL